MKKSAFVLALVAASLPMGPVAFAQTPAPAAAGAQPAAAPAAGSDSSLKFEESEKLSDGEKEARSSAEVQKMREVLKVVLGMLEQARNLKDVIRLNCVNEKLTQIKGFIRIAEQADVALQEDVAKKEEAGANHEFTKIEIAASRVAQIRAEAEACGGTGVYESGSGVDATVVTTEPADLPSNTVAAAAPAAPVTVTPPPPATTSSQDQ